MITPKMQLVLDDLAADTSVEWRVVLGLDIRTRRYVIEVGYHCPLSFLAQTETCNVEAAAAKLGLSEAEATQIANAADDPEHPLRSALLAACRLSEGAV